MLLLAYALKTFLHLVTQDVIGMNSIYSELFFKAIAIPNSGLSVDISLQPCRRNNVAKAPIGDSCVELGSAVGP